MGNQLRKNDLLEKIHLLLGLFVILWINTGLLSYVTVYLPNIIKIAVFFLWFGIACVMKRKYFIAYLFEAILVFVFFIILLMINWANTFIDVAYDLKTTMFFMVVFCILVLY
jgi:hypothetical protein